MRQHKLFYGSSYDRGLQHLLEMWPSILRKYPDTTLDIAYGWDLFDRVSHNNPERVAWKERMVSLMEQKGITHHGRISKDELKKLRESCGIWAYPTHFTEINCHPAGTFIETNKGDEKIEKLSLSDYVRTKDGSYKNITAIRSRTYKGDMYTITPQCGEPFKVTEDHPILIIKSDKGDTSRRFIDVIKKVPQWELAKNIKKYDIVLASRKIKSNNFDIDLSPFESKDDNNFKIDKTFINTTMTSEKIWWFGYFAGDGNANSRGKISCLVADKHIDRDYQKVVDGFHSFGLQTFEQKLNGCVEVYSHSYTLSRYLRNKFYDESKNKILPTELVSIGKGYLLEGLLSSDGSENKKYKGNGTQRTFTNKSRSLISQVRLLLNSIGIAAKIQTRIHKIGTISYSLSWVEYDNQMQNFYQKDDNYIYYKIRDIKREAYDGTVYNIDVDTAHNYHANGIIVHNCITGLECQRDGCVPVTMTLAALDETVQSGIKIKGDIYDDDVYEEYLTALLDLMGDEKRWKEEQQKGFEHARNYDWSLIAQQWTPVFEPALENIKVSIITPTIRKGFWNIMAHNIASQTYKNIEWVIIDDFKDNRQHLAEEYAKKYKLDIKYYRGKPRKVKRTYGLVNANNTGLLHSRGELLVILQDFVLMDEDGIEQLVDVYRKNPDALIAPCDIYVAPKIKPDIESEDWFHGELDVKGDFIRQNVRIKTGQLRESENSYEFEQNYGAIPKKIALDLGGWYEFYDEGLGYDNTDIALRALMAGYRLLVDEGNICTCIDHWDALKGTRENVIGRARKLNDPRYVWAQEMLETGKLPLKRTQEIDDSIELLYDIPEEVLDEDVVKWVREHGPEIVAKWIHEAKL